MHTHAQMSTNKTKKSELNGFCQCQYQTCYNVQNVLGISELVLQLYVKL